MSELGIHQIANELRETLIRYIEAQYHVRDLHVIEERRSLLRETGTIAQLPFLETTPLYPQRSGYGGLGLPPSVEEVLFDLSRLDPGVGVFAEPYRHQAEALEAYFSGGRDLVVATGTGSGKTEAFLYTILGECAREGAERPASWVRSGIRALILYPMNALVSDQLTRLRRLIGDERVASYFANRWGRHPRFGMYTSRTPYPGLRRRGKDSELVGAPLRYYLGLADPPNGLDPARRRRCLALARELQARGRWPAKNLAAFVGGPSTPWPDRYQTSPGDRELFTRHEMHQHCPDVLITNYSMLEYMLMRPVERRMFRLTRDWLGADARNTLLLVLDEAHMYRGVGGAEVALLIRRLLARLGVPRDRLRAILTSASLGEGDAAVHEAAQFAADLTGRPTRGLDRFAPIRARVVPRAGERPGTPEVTEALSALDLAAFFDRAQNLAGARESLASLARRLGWPPPPSAEPADDARELALRAYLAAQLGAMPVLNQLVNATAGQARAFGELARELFPDGPADRAERALASLVALGTYANDGDRPLLPTRAHLFFRGLPSLYACLDPSCSHRRHAGVGGEVHVLGRIYTAPRTHCECSSRARVYEIFAHRDCGAVFLRVFGRTSAPDFYWHEQGGTVEPEAAPFQESFLILERPHDSMARRVEPIWVELMTGRVRTSPPIPAEARRYRACWRPRCEGPTPLLRARPSRGRGRAAGTGRGTSPLVACPNCTRRTAHKILDLATKGEQPFANLVRTQLALQPALRPLDAQYPNGGRKVLLFADGRQKAARLARDLPREVEFDSFRQALAVSIQRLESLGRRVALDDRLYRAFVSVCHDFNLHFFDQEGNAQRTLLLDIEQYRTRYDADLDTLLEEGQSMLASPRFRQALLRQLADPYYALYPACAAVAEPTERGFRDLRRQMADRVPSLPPALVNEALLPLSTAWIQALLERGAYDPEIPTWMRRDVNEFFEPWDRDREPGRLASIVQETGAATPEQWATIKAVFFEVLTRESAEGHPYLSPSDLRLRIAIDDPWLQCQSCGITQHAAVLGRCADCGSDRLLARQPDDPYMTSRHDYIRLPLRAVLQGARPMHVTAEEHTAQLSQRDRGMVYATTEEYELRFQDVLIDVTRPPVDLLSCTTTMEVGVDIGSLTAVGLRNVPPQRENYQQRAGRSGRRGSAVSTVVTYAHDGPHDAHFYNSPAGIISGPPRAPRLKIDNERLAARHIHAYLIQTFFHQTLDDLGQHDEAAITEARTYIMSSLGEARRFLVDDGDFSLQRFRAWAESQIIAVGAPRTTAIANWLPEALLTQPSALQRREEFVRGVARGLLTELERLRTRALTGPQQGETARSAEGSDEVDRAAPPPDAAGPVVDRQTDPSGDEADEPEMLLDVLFDEGLLPSYAFPTDLATFVVFGWDSEARRTRVKERPQQGKDKALSEYAPGRVLVVDKQAYRVGGVYVDDPRVLNPGAALFARPLPLYVSCPQCTYVELRQDRGLQERPCPVCQAGLTAHQMLDPPAFVPEGGQPLRERDRAQELSYATDAQLPTPVRAAELRWLAGPGPYVRIAYQENQELVIANHGPRHEGFRACETCGASWPERDTPSNGRHVRPYPITVRHRQAGIGENCSGRLTTEPFFLGHRFRTDILLLQVALCRPLSYGPREPWLHDGLRSAAEAIALAAGRILSIDPGELAAGYRLMPPTAATPGALAAVEVYLYDTAAGGAGYAAEAGERLGEILEATGILLNGCPGGCERSCTQCLRHYGNRFWHERMDRRLASCLVAYMLTGASPAITPLEQQRVSLTALARYLELEGWAITDGATVRGVLVPLLVKTAAGPVAVGLHPALLDPRDAAREHPLRALSGTHVELINDYTLSRDLPTAYQRFRARVAFGADT